MGLFRKKPVVIEAVELKFTTDSQQECIDFTGGKARKGLDGGLIIPTLEGNMVANTGAWIIKGVNGEFYPCKADIFEKTYERVQNKYTLNKKPSLTEIENWGNSYLKVWSKL